MVKALIAVVEWVKRGDTRSLPVLKFEALARATQSINGRRRTSPETEAIQEALEQENRFCHDASSYKTDNAHEYYHILLGLR
jgi:hypothetical protein